MALSKCTRSNQLYLPLNGEIHCYIVRCVFKTAVDSLLQHTSTTCHFLIKAPYLEKLSVTYDAENVRLSHFSSDENKGSQSIAGIRYSVIKTTYYRQYGINKMGHIMLKPFFAHAAWSFVWLLDLYGGSLGSYLAIPLENEFLKISQT